MWITKKQAGRVAVAGALVATVPFAVSADTAERRAGSTPMTISKYYAKGPASGCDKGEQDAVCSQMIVTPLRFTVPAAAGPRATVSLSFQYRTMGAGRHEIFGGSNSNKGVLPANRALGRSSVPTSTTVQFQLRDLVPGSEQSFSFGTNTELGNVVVGSTGVTTSKVLVTIEFRRG
ncbi:MAG TPA: hypothetical protein VFK52_11455 [Nocardioidaceae bacterium]|nr:hypothetical protein [Nocardioidaceae bacterium]